MFSLTRIGILVQNISRPIRKVIKVVNQDPELALFTQTGKELLVIAELQLNLFTLEAVRGVPGVLKD